MEKIKNLSNFMTERIWIVEGKSIKRGLRNFDQFDHSFTLCTPVMENRKRLKSYANYVIQSAIVMQISMKQNAYKFR